MPNYTCAMHAVDHRHGVLTVCRRGLLDGRFCRSRQQQRTSFHYLRPPSWPSTDPAAAVPGPGAYAQPDLPRGPAYSLTGWPVAGGQDGGGKAPGPGAYDVGVAESGAPAWMMGAKVQESSMAGEHLGTWRLWQAYQRIMARSRSSGLLCQHSLQPAGHADGKQQCFAACACRCCCNPRAR